MIDQNPGRQVADWNNQHNTDTLILAGAEYALLRPEFRELRASTHGKKYNTGELPRILICFGGVDPRGLTFNYVQDLFTVFNATAEFDIIVGRESANLDKLKRLALLAPTLKLHIDSNDVAALMASATVAIGAPGSMTLERCCLHLPSILISVAENQLETGKMAEKLGFAYYLGHYTDVSSGCIVKKLSLLLEQPELYKAMQQCAGNITDGLGVNRITSIFLKNNR